MWPVLGSTSRPEAGIVRLRKMPGGERVVVLVAGDDQDRQRELAQADLEVVERGPPRLHAAHRAGGAQGVVLAEPAHHLLPAARVLGLELDARGAAAIDLGEAPAAALLEASGGLLGLGAEARLLRLLGAVADAGADQRERAPRVVEAEVQRREGAHRQADDMRALDPGAVEDRQDVGRGARLAVGRRFRGHVGGRIAARVVGEAAVAPAEEAQLRLPAAVVARELVDEHDRHAFARLLVVEADAVVGLDVRHPARCPPQSANSKPIVRQW